MAWLCQKVMVVNFLHAACHKKFYQVYTFPKFRLRFKRKRNGLMADSSSGLGSLILSQGTLVRIQYPSLGHNPMPTINKEKTNNFTKGR